MKLSSITEMAAKQFCPQCGLTMAKNHYWYKGGWRCKSGNRAASDSGAAQGSMPSMKQQTNTVPPDFAVKIAAVGFGDVIKLKDGTDVRFLGGGKGAETKPEETLYPVRVAGGPDDGQLIMVRPDELDI